MQHDAITPMPTLAQFVGEACLAQGEDPGKRDVDLSLVNQLSDGLQAFAGGTATREKQGAYAKLVRFFLRWLACYFSQEKEAFCFSWESISSCCQKQIIPIARVVLSF
jgi:hypothetical protein